MKRWRVQLSDMWGGKCIEFFLRSSAFKYAENNKNGHPCVIIFDIWTNKIYEIKVPKKWPIPLYDKNMCFTGRTFGEYEY